VRDADGRLQVVGKRFNAFTAEQWLTADGDDRDPASARDPHALCDRDGCVAALPAGRSLSVVTGPAGFEEDCARGHSGEPTERAGRLQDASLDQQVFDQRRLALTGAVGLIWDGSRFAVATDRSILEDRPWSPAPKRAPDDGIMPPPSGGTLSADPADP
jgi:competence protein ComEC